MSASSTTSSSNRAGRASTSRTTWPTWLDQTLNREDTVHGTQPEFWQKTRIDVLAITPTTAIVRVDMEKDVIGLDYTDFHSLLKQDGTWRIIAKVYHAYEG